MMLRPELLTFDIFGTVVDWRAGFVQALADEGHPDGLEVFDTVMDWQIDAEQSDPERPYTSILAESLTATVGMGSVAAARVASTMTHWPVFPDSPPGMASLLHHVRCVAMTNSDREHCPSVQQALGVRMSDWVCAEDAGCYKPDIGMWRHTASRTGVDFGPHWWHVSAYADYDLGPASSLGLTCVLVRRSHCRPGPGDVDVPDLLALAAFVGEFDG
jgi:2-haloacid dehalogenase